MERNRSTRLQMVLGLSLVAAIVLTIVVIFESFTGAFGSEVVVRARLSQASDALAEGDIVTYRDTIVGEVSGSTGNVDGSADLTLKIRASAADVIPDNVTVVAVPQSLFGATKIVLLPSDAPAPNHLTAATELKPDTRPAVESLQAALTKAYALLTAVHPAQLDAALGAIASALQGQGQNLGDLLSKADSYLRDLRPHLGELNQVLTGLATVSREVAADSPALLNSLSNLLVVGKGILQSRQAVADLLSVAPAAVDDANRVFDDATVNNLVAVVVNQNPVLRALGERPESLPGTIRGFKTFADVVSSTIRDGQIHGSVILTGLNIAELANVVLRKPSDVLKSVTDPQPYTAAQCPRYEGAAGPNCSSAAPSADSARLLTSGDNYGGTTSSVGSAAELRAVSGAARAIAGVPTDLAPSITDLFLGPLLRGTPVVVR